jgi:hypothetical protein
MANTSDSRFIDNLNETLKQITAGIEAANQINSGSGANSGNYYNLQPPQQSAISAGINPAMWWLVGGAAFIGGSAFLAKRYLDD